MKGKGFSITMWNCETAIADKPQEMCSVIDEIIKLIEMKGISDFMIAKGGDFMPGYSVTKIIETSHIACHGFEVNNAYMLSLESCKDFDEAKLKEFILSQFKPKGFNLVLYPIDTVVEVTQ